MQLSWRGSFRLNPSRKKVEKVIIEVYSVLCCSHVFWGDSNKKKKGGGKEKKKLLVDLLKSHRYFPWLGIFVALFPKHTGLWETCSPGASLGQYGLLFFSFFICYVLGVFNPRDTAVCYRTPLCYVPFCFSYVEEKCLNRIERDRWLVWRMKELTP